MRIIKGKRKVSVSESVPIPKKVLVIGRLYHEWERQLYGKVVFICASSAEETRSKFFKNVKGLDAVVVETNSMLLFPILEGFKKSFDGHMIAIPKNDFYREHFSRCGCNHECTQGEMPQKLREVLGL